MRLYSGTSTQFIEDNAHNSIVNKLKTAFFEYYRQEPQENEVRSWYNSLKEVSQVFEQAQLLDHGILLEYQLPLTSKRLDCLICGKDINNKDNAVIIELKQWQTSETSNCANEVVTWLGGDKRDVLHPSAQVGQYKLYLEDVHTAFNTENDNITLNACSFLHNYIYEKEDAILAPKFDNLINDYPLFSANDKLNLQYYLKDRLINGDGLKSLEKIENGKFKPSKKLMEHVEGVIRKRDKYTLLDEQKIIYDKVFTLVKQAQENTRKTAIIVKGGPGTGKSVIALNLLADLLHSKYKAHYATGSKSFTETLWNILGFRSKAVFKYFNNYTDAKGNELDVIICDEAHRIRESSNTRFTKDEKKSKVPQLYEILRVAKVSIFFIDDNQIVRPGEVGSIQKVKDYAISKNVDIIEYELDAQFRCNGSDGFINWINNTLKIKDTANVIWKRNSESFNFKIFPSPLELENAIRLKEKEGFSARMTAGFCWKWTVPIDGKSLVNDVQIGEYQRPWNAHHNAKRLPANIPKASLWAYDPNGINQVGCVYTAQGFEFDYIGVIIGKDMVYDFENQQWKGNPKMSEDGTVKYAKQHFLDYVKNTYKILLTRGMKGCYVYFQDQETERFFKSRLE